MRLLSLATLLLLTTLSVAYTTTIDQIISDVVAIDKSVKALTSAVSLSDGGLYSKAGIAALFAVVAVNTAKGGIDAHYLPPVAVNATDVGRAIATVQKTLDITNPLAVKTFESKKVLFQSWGQDVIVRGALRLILQEHLYFSNAVLERTPPEYLEEANTAVDIISHALEAGIATFSS
ncbi:hypothetical protein DV737_g917, partial [Chaetothyriales sp. CBS 132003]